MKVSNKIVLRGHEYATPRTESVEIKNQGVLCGSGGGSKSYGMHLGADSGGLN